MYIDDVYIATLTGSMLDLLDLERVEILRGPQGTLAGRNSIGGSVKLYSKRPTAKTAVPSRPPTVRAIAWTCAAWRISP